MKNNTDIKLVVQLIEDLMHLACCESPKWFEEIANEVIPQECVSRMIRDVKEIKEYQAEHPNEVIASQLEVDHFEYLGCIVSDMFSNHGYWLFGRNGETVIEKRKEGK